MKRPRKEIGVRWIRGCPQVFAKIDGKFRSSPMLSPHSTPAERATEREKLFQQFGGRARPVVTGSFASDVQTFLAKPEVKALPSVTKKNGKAGAYVRMLAWWVEYLGADRASTTIQRDEVEAGIQQLLASGMAPATVYHYRTPLLRMWTVLHGKDAPNPARGTTRPEHYRETEKSIDDYKRIVAILDAMPTERAIKKGIRVPSIARLVAVTIAATGIPVAELNKLQRRFFQPTFGYIEMPWRNKGAGVEGHRRQLLAPGIEALAALFARFPDGRIQVSDAGCTHSFKRAARRVCGPETPISLYWLRHTFGTDVYRQTQDIEAVRRLLGHAEGSVCTARYTKGAHVEVDRAALEKLAAARAKAVQPDVQPGPRLHAKLHTPRKSQRKQALRGAA